MGWFGLDFYQDFKVNHFIELIENRQHRQISVEIKQLLQLPSDERQNYFGKEGAQQQLKQYFDDYGRTLVANSEFNKAEIITDVATQVYSDSRSIHQLKLFVVNEQQRKIDQLEQQLTEILASAASLLANQEDFRSNWLELETIDKDNQNFVNLHFVSQLIELYTQKYSNDEFSDADEIKSFGLQLLSDESYFARQIEVKTAYLDESKTQEIIRNQGLNTEFTPINFIPVIAERDYSDEKIKVDVKSIRLARFKALNTEGDFEYTDYDNYDINQLIEQALGENQTMSFDQLDNLTFDITRFVVTQLGWFLSTVYIPAQMVVDGKVELVLMEGKLGDVVVLNRSENLDLDLQALKHQAETYFGEYRNKIVFKTAMKQALIDFMHNSGVIVIGEFSPANRIGYTKLTLKVAGEIPVGKDLDDISTPDDFSFIVFDPAIKLPPDQDEIDEFADEL